MNDNSYKAALEVLLTEPNFNSDDLKNLAGIYANYNNKHIEEYRAGITPERDAVYESILFLIRDKILFTVMRQSGYNYKHKATEPVWAQIV